jgi:hypothetical protein
MVTIYKNEGGMIALYRGIAPTVAGVAPYVSEGTFILSDLSALRMLLTCDFQGWSELHDI